MKSLEKLAEETFPGGYSCPSKALGTLAVRAKMVKAVRKWLNDIQITLPISPIVESKIRDNNVYVKIKSEDETGGKA